MSTTGPPNHFYYDEGRRFGLEGSWPADQGAVIEKALERLARKVPEGPEDLWQLLFEESRVEARRARRPLHALLPGGL